MYYELYLDVLFLINLFMDFLLLMTAKMLLKSNTKYLRIFLGSLIGALGVCIFTVVPFSFTIMRVFLFYVLINGTMVKVGLKTRGKVQFLKGVICVYLGGFLLGGIYQWMSFRIKSFFAISIGSYLILKLGLHLLTKFQRKNNRIYQITLFQNGKRKQITALKDTGNSLKDPLSRKPVCILEMAAAKELLDETDQNKIKAFSSYEITEDESLGLHYIPFHSIGESNGMLPAVVLDQLCIQGEESSLVKKPVVALYDGSLSSSENYQMILHPDLLESQESFI